MSSVPRSSGAELLPPVYQVPAHKVHLRPISFAEGVKHDRPQMRLVQGNGVHVQKGLQQAYEVRPANRSRELGHQLSAQAMYGNVQDTWPSHCLLPHLGTPV